ncbi:hypothetical protein OBBRIDRAFT_742975, partial [Obba rivulosa]
ELEHRSVKKFYVLTNKKNYAKQIAKHQRCKALLRGIVKRADGASRKAAESENGVEDGLPLWADRFAKDAEQPTTTHASPNVHYHVSQKARAHDMLEWVTQHKDDPAVSNFIPKLTDHILARLSGQDYNDDEREYSSAERQTVRFMRNKLYQHKKLQINFTTYDMRRRQESINPRTRSDIMLLAHENDDELVKWPFWYARVVGIFHVNVMHEQRPRQWSPEQQINFLLVRWYGRNMKIGGGFANKRLPCLGFLDGNEPGAFGFLDPADVIRASHIIPSFSYGRTSGLMGPSIARREDEEDEDWEFYYVNMYVCLVDCLTFMH